MVVSHASKRERVNSCELCLLVRSNEAMHARYLQADKNVTSKGLIKVIAQSCEGLTLTYRSLRSSRRSIRNSCQKRSERLSVCTSEK